MIITWNARPSHFGVERRPLNSADQYRLIGFPAGLWYNTPQALGMEGQLGASSTPAISVFGRP